MVDVSRVGGFTTIRYMKKAAIQTAHSKDNMSPEAKKIIDGAGQDDILILRIRVNSPAFIEKALLLSPENLAEIVQ